MLWVLEKESFPNSHSNLEAAAIAAGQKVIPWNYGWSRIPPMPVPIVFHGPLDLCARIHAESDWKPGAFCDVNRFAYSAYWHEATRWLLNTNCTIVPLRTLVANPESILKDLLKFERGDEIFIRPDGPLKQFSGRVLRRDNITMHAVDFGFYFEDEMLPVVVAPAQKITKEWRYVVINKKIVASSGYDPLTHKGIHSNGPDDKAAEIARELTVAGEVYVMDLCHSDGEILLLELNPFSGADFYCCSGERIVSAMTDYLG
jgi:hypothetical protein